MLATMGSKTIAGTVLAGAVALTLVGCASSSGEPAAVESSSAPLATRSVPPNMNACANFGVLVNSIPEVANADDGIDQWEALRGDFDTVALSATGVTQERMLTFVEDWPEAIDVILWNEFDDLNASIEGVERACTADGNTTSFGELTTS